VSINLISSPPTNQAPTVNITAPANNATFTAPATVNLSAAASDADGTISKVEFYRGATLIGTVTTPTAGAYSFSNTNVAAGTYSYTAKAYDSAAPAAVTTSAAVNVTVSGTAPATVTYQYDELGRLIGVTR
jgi:YD repeat-containing protein